MDDPLFQFPNAGFDDKQAQAAVTQARHALTQLQAAMEPVINAFREIWDGIVRVCSSILREMSRFWCRSFVPRQYRNTMMRRKIRGAVRRGFAGRH